MKRISLLISVLLLAACQIHSDESRRNKILKFAANHPVAAQAIGLPGENAVNITGNAARFALKTGLDNQANGGEGLGTQVNAVRHTLWQAAIAARFGTEIAEKIGNAYENDTSIRESKTQYFSRAAADQAADLRNNRVGRTIGAAHPDTDMKTLAQAVLNHYQKEGLWTARPVTEKGRTSWRISRAKISRAEFQAATNRIKILNENGFSPEEQKEYDKTLRAQNAGTRQESR